MCRFSFLQGIVCQNTDVLIQSLANVYFAVHVSGNRLFLLVRAANNFLVISACMHFSAIFCLVSLDEARR